MGCKRGEMDKKSSEENTVSYGGGEGLLVSRDLDLMGV